jgi:hypothetical protein
MSDGNAQSTPCELTDEYLDVVTGGLNYKEIKFEYTMQKADGAK